MYTSVRRAAVLRSTERRGVNTTMNRHAENVQTGKNVRKTKKIIVPTEYEKELIEGKENYQKNIELYKKRQQLSEHPFETIKRGLRRDHFLLRTLPKVEIEKTLNNLTYNLIRVVNIYTGSETGPGFDILLCRLKKE